MNIIILDKEITSKTANKVIDWCNDLEEAEGIILIDSVGGCPLMAELISKAISQKSGVKILIGYEAGSAALEIVLFSKNKVEISDYFVKSTAHQTNYSSLSSRELSSDKSTHTSQCISAQKRLNKIDNEKYGKILTKKELELFNRGEDVILGRKRMLTILKKLGK